MLFITNSVALVSERTIPTEQPPLNGEDSAYFQCFAYFSKTHVELSLRYQHFRVYMCP
jgi:hypothetical protein